MIAIAIDGPSGAGKSSIARKMAEKMGYIYVDTGAMFRALGLKFLKNKVGVDDIETVKKILSDTTVDIAFKDGEQRVILDGVDVSDDIRTPEVSSAASRFSAISEVRLHLLDMQRALAKNNNVIMDGRDIGTVVLPNADIKIFLTASAEERAQRRYRELIEKGQDVKYEDVLADMKKRDYDDSHRAVAPLKRADDAVDIDTTGNSLEESVEMLYEFIKSKGV